MACSYVQNSIIRKMTVISGIFLRTKFYYPKNDRNYRQTFTYKI